MKSETKSVTAVMITAEQKAEFLNCLKQTGSLAARVALCFKAIFDATFEESESDNEFAVAKIVKAQLVLLATDAGYSESTAERVLSECLTANGLVKATAGKRTGAPVVVVPERAYKAAAAAFDVLAGNGTLPGKKILAQVAKILSLLGQEKLTIAEVKTYKAPAPVVTEVEKSKVVEMPKTEKKAA